MGIQQLSVLDVAPTMAGRLLVLLPGGPFEDSALSCTLERLANSEDRTVVFLGLAATQEDEARLRRRVAGITHVEGRRRNPQVRVARGMSWSAAIDAVRQDGDVIFFPYRDVSDVRQASAFPARDSSAHASAHFPREALPALKESLKGLVALLLDWASPLLIVIGFFFIQVSIDRALSGPGHDALIMLSVLVEIAALWRWEQWSSGRLRS
jgi:hypothetical protein